MLVVKNPPASAGDIRGSTLNPGLGRSPGEGHGNPLQYSCLENPMDRGAWRAIVHGVTKSRTPLKWLSSIRKLFYIPHQRSLTPWWCLNMFLHLESSTPSPKLHSFQLCHRLFISNSPAAAAAKSLQSCLTLWDPIDGSPPGSPIPGILQARTLEWVAISSSNAWKWSHSVVSDS